MAAESIIDQLFFQGSVDYEPEEVAPGVTVQYRSLTVQEEIDVAEAANRANSLEARNLLFVVHRLARAIRYVNNRPLDLNPADRDALRDRLGREPSRTEEAVELLLRKVSRLALQELFVRLQQHEQELADKLEEVKKKLNPTPDGEQQSES